MISLDFVIHLVVTLLVLLQADEPRSWIKVVNLPANETWQNTVELDGTWVAQIVHAFQLPRDENTIVTEDSLLFDKLLENEAKIVLSILVRKAGEIEVGSMRYSLGDARFHLENLEVRLISSSNKHIAIIRRKGETDFWLANLVKDEKNRTLNLYLPDIETIKEGIISKRKVDNEILDANGSRIYLLSEDEFKVVFEGGKKFFQSKPALTLMPIHLTNQKQFDNSHVPSTEIDEDSR